MPLMYQMRQGLMLTNSTKTIVLKIELKKLRKETPLINDERLYHQVLKFTIPTTLPRCPSYHRKNFKNLITMVDMWGLPSFFLTLTVEETK